MKIKKREIPKIIFLSDNKWVNGKYIKKKFIPLRNFLKKTFWVSVFLLLGYELDFSENIISRKNIVIMILSAVAIILYDEFGWGVFPSNYYEFDVYEKKGLSEHWCDTCQEDNKKIIKRSLGTFVQRDLCLITIFLFYHTPFLEKGDSVTEDFIIIIFIFICIHAVIDLP